MTAAPPIDVRVVELFAEPGFTELTNRLLFEPGRTEVLARLFPAADTPSADPATPAAPPVVQRVRIGAFDGDRLVAWTSGWREPGGTIYVGSSAVEPEYRRQGLYTRLIRAMEDHALSIGCRRVTSHHRPDNSAVLIAKLKAGYVICGVEVTTEMGLLVKMVRHLDAQRDAVFRARIGPIERLAQAPIFNGAPPA